MNSSTTSRLFAAVALTAMLLGRPTKAQIVAYHDQNGAQHQAQHDLLSPLGYRMTALSIYGTTSNLQYAAVWVHRAGPSFVAFHGLDAAAYQTFADTYAPLGYRPKILTATGSAANPRFAGTYELTNAAGWSSHGLTEQQFWSERNAAQEQGLDVTAVDIYSTGADPRYIAAFGPVSAGQAEVVSGGDSSYQDHFGALANGHARPALIAFNDDHRYVSLWRSDDIGDWVGHHDMTSAQYQTYFDTYILQNRYPISVQASGSGSALRFAAVWAPSDLPVTRVWTTTGAVVPQFAPFDAWVNNWMNVTGTRAASLAIVRDARLVYARGYTLARAGYPATQPTSLFEIASCSKPLTSICMHQHFADASLDPSDPMTSFFGGVIAADARVAQINLDTLLTHRGGWNRDVSPDPMIGLDPTIASAFGLSLPISKWSIYRYMIGTQMLDVDPNTEFHYSNFGYSVLGQVLETRHPGLTYAQIMQQGVFGPLGITRPRIAMTLGLHPGEVTYHPWVPMLDRSVMSDSRPWIPGQYGAWNKENMDAHGAWVLAAPDYAKVLAAFDLGASNPLLSPAQTTAMWTVQQGYSTLMRGWFLRNVPALGGGTVPMYTHNGRLAGAVSLIARRADGLSFVFLTNGDRYNLFDTHAEELSNIANTITLWPNNDLFPQFSLPAFQRVQGAVTTFGNACRGQRGLPTFAATGTPDVGAQLSFDLGNAPAGQLAFTVLGLQQTGTSLTPLGATGCWLYTNPLATFAAVTGRTGTASFPWRAPASATAIGLSVIAQGACLDPAANQLGLVTSQALNVRLGGWR